MSVLNNRSFNVRVHVGEDGELVVGWVHGMYEVSDEITDIKPIPAEEQAALARLLGIEHSTNPHVGRLLRASTACGEGQKEVEVLFDKVA